jgi:hypothetical protein
MRNKSSHRSGQPTRLDSAVKEQSADFWKSKTLEELAAEQGIHPVENLDEVLGQGADLWRDDAELETFLAALRELRQAGA